MLGTGTKVLNDKYRIEDGPFDTRKEAFEEVEKYHDSSYMTYHALKEDKWYIVAKA